MLRDYSNFALLKNASREDRHLFYVPWDVYKVVTIPGFARSCSAVDGLRVKSGTFSASAYSIYINQSQEAQIPYLCLCRSLQFAVLPFFFMSFISWVVLFFQFWKRKNAAISARCVSGVASMRSCYFSSPVLYRLVFSCPCDAGCRYIIQPLWNANINL